MKAYLQVTCNNEYASCPGYVELEVTDTFIAQIEGLAAICVKHKLDEVRTSDVAAIWQGDRSYFVDEEFKIRGQRLEVAHYTGGPVFQLFCYDEWGGDDFASEAVALSTLRAEIEKAKAAGKDRVEFGLDEGYLDQALTEEKRVADDDKGYVDITNTDMGRELHEMLKAADREGA